MHEHPYRLAHPGSGDNAAVNFKTFVQLLALSALWAARGLDPGAALTDLKRAVRMWFSGWSMQRPAPVA